MIREVVIGRQDQAEATGDAAYRYLFLHRSKSCKFLTRFRPQSDHPCGEIACGSGTQTSHREARDDRCVVHSSFKSPSPSNFMNIT
jgi:hypothetical protein